MNTNHITEHDLGDGVTVRFEKDRLLLGTDKTGAAYVSFNGAYRFTCASIDEARQLKDRAMAL